MKTFKKCFVKFIIFLKLTIYLFKLSKQVSDEFFNEGDLEKEKFKKEPIDSMNRNKSEQLPKIQTQFLQTVCVPLYKVSNTKMLGKYYE